ncbi:MAG: antibiotic biosynthesis monooxygenase [Methanomicrobiaceae archaeon]|nr:antibiotic biosynthesis monooxygenase [Methanomicrobiaceae archaeon]
MVDEGAFFTVGLWTVKSGKEEEFVKKWQEFARWSLDAMEGGSWAYLVQDREQKNRFVSFGPWDSLETIAAWRQTTEFKSAIAEFRGLCEEVTPGTMQEVAHFTKPSTPAPG